MPKRDPDDVIDSLHALDRIRNDLPGLRANLLALAWSVSVRNINKLAREADVSRVTVYKDLRSRDINPKLRDDTAEPTYPPVSGRMIADLAALIDAHAIVLMREDEPPTSDVNFAFETAFLLHQIGQLLEMPTEPAVDDKWENYDGRPWQLVAILDALQNLVELTCSSLAEHTTDRQAAQAFSRDRMTDTRFDGYIEAATFRLATPDGRTVNFEITRDEIDLLTIRSDVPREDIRANRHEHLALANSFRFIAEALKPRFSSEPHRES